MRASDASPLHGMAVFTPPYRFEPGMNRSLLMALPALRSENIHLQLARPRSTRHALFRSLRAMLRQRRGRLDFMLINSLGALSNQDAHGLAMLRMARLLRLPIAIYWHETDWIFDRIRQDSPRLYAAIVRNCSDPSVLHLTASARCSECIRRLMPGTQPVEIYECARIPPLFDEPAMPAEPPMVLNIASVQKRKGPDLFIETAVEACRRHPDVCFRWLGNGPELDRSRQRAGATPFAARIQFPGLCDHPYMDLRSASALFLSSRDDPFPLAVLEAMCLARPVVAFDIGGLSEAFGGQGQLVPAFETAAAADAILRCLQAPPSQRLLPALRERYLRLYTPSAFASRLGAVLRTHVDKMRNGGRSA